MTGALPSLQAVARGQQGQKLRGAAPGRADAWGQQGTAPTTLADWSDLTKREGGWVRFGKLLQDLTSLFSSLDCGHLSAPGLPWGQGAGLG